MPNQSIDAQKDELAKQLYDRYCAFSGIENHSSSPCRTIVVVGAGASKAACNLPTGRELAIKVREHIIKQIQNYLIDQ